MNPYEAKNGQSSRTGNSHGILVLLVVANLSIAMSHCARLPIWLDLRHIFVPALSMASVLLFSFSMIFVVSLTVRTQSPRALASLAIANGILAMMQQCIFVSSWLT